MFADWKVRQSKQACNAMPGYTSLTLRYIRINACRDDAPAQIEGAKW